MTPIKRAAAALAPEPVFPADGSDPTEHAARVVLGSVDPDGLARVLDRHEEEEVDDHGNIRCTCAATSWHDDVLMFHDHQAAALRDYLTREDHQ